MKVVTFLDKMKVPFFVFVSLTWAIEIINAFLRAFGIGPFYYLFIIVSVFYFIVSVLTASFFLYYGRRLLATLKDPGVAKDETKNNKFRVRYNNSIRMFY